MTTSPIFVCEGTTLKRYRGRRKHVIVPQGTETIANGVFFRRKSVETITLPATVSSIGLYAFAGCESLESIVILGHLKFIGVGLFDGCTNLKRLVFPPTDEELLGILLCECRKIEKVEFTDGTEADLETIKNKGAQVRRARAKDKRDGELVLDKEAREYIRKK